jgi:hypothetical protein
LVSKIQAESGVTPDSLPHSSDWDPWLGPEGPITGNPFKSPGKPLGATGMGDVYNVVTVDGAPAIRISGRVNGSIEHKRIICNYHLQLFFRWGQKKSESAVLNSGLLYHSFGPPGGGFNNTWAKSIEYEIMQGSVGMLLPIGLEIGLKIETAVDGKTTRFMVGGKLNTFEGPAMIQAGKDAEKPVGEWNKIELYALDDRAIHVVNGIPVLYVQDMHVAGEDKVVTPLTKGRIQLQSEGAEIFYRDITVEPINSLPKIVPHK